MLFAPRNVLQGAMYCLQQVAHHLLATAGYLEGASWSRLDMQHAAVSKALALTCLQSNLALQDHLHCAASTTTMPFKEALAAALHICACHLTNKIPVVLLFYK
jgi:hypothetical protein